MTDERAGTSRPPLPLRALDDYMSGAWFRRVQIKCSRCPKSAVGAVWAIGDPPTSYVTEYSTGPEDQDFARVVLDGAHLEVNPVCPRHGTGSVDAATLRLKAIQGETHARSRLASGGTPRSVVVRIECA